MPARSPGSTCATAGRDKLPIRNRTATDLMDCLGVDGKEADSIWVDRTDEKRARTRLGAGLPGLDRPRRPCDPGVVRAGPPGTLAGHNLAGLRLQRARQGGVR